MAKVLTAAAALALSIFAVPVVSSAKTELTEARVTRIIREVQLLPEQAAPHPAALQDTVRGGTAIRTGVESRTELTFPDQTLARLGANTLFSFSGATRALDLGGGAMLLHVPKGAGGAKILTAAVTAAITGTTVLIEYHPPRQAGGAHRREDFSSLNRGVKKNDLSSNSIKFITLEGVARIYIKGRPGEPILVPAGKEMVISPDGSSYDLVEVSVEELVKTSSLITDFSPLPSYPLIVEEIQRQRDERIAGEMMETEGVASRDPLSLDTVDQSFSAGAMPLTPSKFGTPSTITSPNPYVITSGTTITTDLSITTNGVTDFGKIWRGQAQDGRLSAFIFGSSSTFDAASGFDAEINGQNSMGGAVFKFTSLQLTGNPTISTPTGVINLGLIAVNGITSGGPGGILTFAGIHGLLLATQNGSITLGPEISFSGIHDINFYARGVDSNLTLGSAISGGAKISLWAQGNIQINGNESATDFRAFSGGDFLAGSGTITAQTIDIESLSNINIDSRQFPDFTGNFTVNAAGTLNATLHPGSGDTSHFSGTSLTAQGNTINLQGTVNPTTFDLGSAIVSLTAGSGGIQAPDILFANGSSLLLQTTNGGDINIYGTQNGANDTIVAGGAFTSQSDVSALTLQAGTSINIGGSVVAADSIRAGTTINVAGELSSPSVSAGGDVTAANIQATIDSSNGGTIGSAATINVNAANISTGGSLFADIFNSRGGSIGGNAEINFALTGDLTIQGTQGVAEFAIDNNPGTIGANATISVSAANITANSFLAQIDNTGGSIGGNATINMNVSGNTSIATDATVEILGNNPSGSAAINFNGGSYAIGSPGRAGMFLGFITGNGTIAFNNASVRAEVIKAGVFGPNGVLNIGGGILSADSELKLYAPGSNGRLNFLSNVTLGGAGAKILAANSVTIFNNVVVTIGGPNSADVYTNNANYTGFGGNGTTTGTFAGAGAHDPQPLSSAPPFDLPPPGHPNRATRTGPAINVNDTAELLALLDATSTGPNGRVVVNPRRAQNSRTVDPGGRNGRSLLAADQAEVRNRRLRAGVQLR